MSEKTKELLLVEDNPADARLLREIFKENKISTNLNVVEDGIEAMAFLRRQGKYARAARPDLILLDLNLPRKDGREALAEIKKDPGLKRIPLVVLTTSKAEDDILRSYDLHANCYIVKPMDLEEFIKVVKCLEDFWFHMVTLPPE